MQLTRLLHNHIYPYPSLPYHKIANIKELQCATDYDEDNDEQVDANVVTNNDNMHIEEIKTNKYGLSTLSNPLNEKNWVTWSKRIIPILKVCKVYRYVKGTILKPNLEINLNSAQNWDTNDKYAKLLMLQNVASEQIQHINQDQS